MLEKIVVKELVAAKDLEQVQHLSKHIWGSDSIPLHQTLGAVNNGGIVNGAYLDNILVGFSYGYSGYKDGQVYFTSHMLGVEQIYRENGIGELLKHHQKELARERNYRVIKSVFDPLEAHSGSLTFTKLNAISTTYIQNYYGEMQDDFNRGLPTDRLQTEWWLEREAVDDIIDELVETAEEIVPWSLTAVGLPTIDSLNVFDPDIAYYEDAYLIAIPQVFQKVKIESLTLAEDWRYKIRTILTTLFAQGYAIVRVQQRPEHVHMYVLVKSSLLAL